MSTRHLHGPAPRAQRVPAAGALLAVLAGLTALLAVRFAAGLGNVTLEALADGWIYHAVIVGAAALCLARRDLPWVLLGLAFLVWAAGSVYWTVALDPEALPAFSAADLCWLAFYPLAYAGLLLLLPLPPGSIRGGRWLDGVVCALALAAAGAALVLDPVLDATSGARLGIVAVNLAYPIGDLLLVALLVGAAAAAGWRTGRAWTLLAAGMACFAAADAVYVRQVALDVYAVGTLVDLGWVAAAVVVAAASVSTGRPSSAREERARSLVFPAGFALLALAVLVVDHFVRVNAASLALAAAALLLVVVRFALIFREKLSLVAAARREASTDAVTGLWNRRRLLADLTFRLDGHARRPGLLVLFDLDGFKLHNDSVGHLAGDALLERLARRLAAAAAPGEAYRMGGDEFCVLVDPDEEDEAAVAARLGAALTEDGEGFSVTASYGAVRLGEEASSPAAALRLADRRMYQRKRRNPHSVVTQTASVLLGALAERGEELERRAVLVAHLAGACGAGLGLEAEDVERLRTAALLADVGLLAVPETVLRKPGPLDETELELVRAHPLVGARILSAASGLAALAPVVRATHERLDGAGYPDGLAGSRIPLAARVIHVCDTYAALVSGRPFAGPVSPEEAVAELDRAAGTQLDGDVVTALVHALALTAIAATAA